jgi:branched-chain amino acid transport system ATP-binding protein
MLRPVTAYRDNLTAARRLLEAVDLWENRYLPVSALSYGRQRQAEVLLVLASKPVLLVLDEPNAGLSMGETVDLVRMIRTFAGETSLFLCSHDIDLVFTLADRVMVLYYGQIIAQGRPEEVQRDPRVREIYLGTSGRNA